MKVSSRYSAYNHNDFMAIINFPKEVGAVVLLIWMA
jgi:hypothetical protein